VASVEGLIEAVRAIVFNVDGVAFAAEKLAQKGAQLNIVVHQEQAHDSSVSCGEKDEVQEL